MKLSRPLVCAVVWLGACLLSGGCSLVGSSTPPPATPGGTTAAGSSLGSASSTAVSPSTSPPPPPVMPAVPGYTLSVAPDAVQKSFGKVASQFPGVFAGLTVRSVKKAKVSTGTVVALGLKPELIGNATIESKLVPGMITGMSGQGAKVTKKKISGQEVAVATTKTTSIVAWYRTGTLVLVLGTGDETTSVAFATAYLKAS